MQLSAACLLVRQKMVNRFQHDGNLHNRASEPYGLRRGVSGIVSRMLMTGAILAGGRSRRMGRDKATLPFKNRPLIAHVYRTVKAVLPDVVVISKHHTAIEGIESPIMKDAIPIEGSLVGIASALLHARTDYVFVFGCDMPFLRKETITRMVDVVQGEHIIIPRTPAGYEPLHAIYNRSCLSHMLRAIEEGKIGISKLFPYFKVKVVEEPQLFLNNGVSIFTNINTEEDLDRAERFIAGRNGNGNEGV
ncbi:MAG TPA: molybdenum cofactor guanylyltransferase [Syntrophorhabdales bacterium]|nr:molybdenum cofactor guanylyltransferase [Syntrophorhabdales bacterium]